MQGLMSILLTIFVISVQSKELPEYLRNARCHINEGFEKCIKDNGNKIIPQVAEGVPELHIPSANPLKLDFIQLINTQQLQVNVTNVEVYGLNETVIVNAKSDSRKGEFKLLLANKNITIVGKYSANGKVLVLPVVGEGKFSICLKEGIFNETTFTQLVNRDGDDYIKLMDLILSAHFQGVIFDFQNLFNGNKQLGDQVNLLLNENWEYLIENYGPGILQVFRRIREKQFGSLVDQFPFKALFIID